MIVATMKCNVFPAPGSLDNLPTFLEPPIALIAILAKGGVLVGERPATNPKAQPSLAQHIHHRIVLRYLQRMAQRQVGNSSIESNTPCTLGSGGQYNGRVRTDERLSRGQEEEMFTNPIRIETQAFSMGNLIDLLFVERRKHSRVIFIRIEYGEYAKPYHLSPPSEETAVRSCGG